MNNPPQLTNVIEIPQKKDMVALMSMPVFPACFTLGSIFMFIKASAITDKAIAVAGILFFGAWSIYFLRQLFAKAPTIIIANEGIIDNSATGNLGITPWTEVMSINKIEEEGSGGASHLIILKIKHPEKPTKKRGGPMANFLSKVGAGMCENQIDIDVQCADFSADQVKSLIEARRAKAAKYQQ